MSPDGRSIAFEIMVDEGSGDVYVMSATDDGASPRNITKDTTSNSGPAWRPVR